MRIKSTFLFILFLLSVLSARTQVVIGLDTIPDKWAVLELFSTTDGLRYPQLTEQDKDNLGTEASLKANPEAHGLMIFNTGNAGNMEYLCENGGWTELYNPLPSSNRTQGTATISGGNRISGLSGANPVNNAHFIEFVSTAGITDLKVGKYLDFNNIVQSVTWNGTLGASNRLMITFHSKVVALANERTSNNPLRFTLYVTYKENGVEKQVDFEITVTKN
jgi:hypothetical protein